MEISNEIKLEALKKTVNSLHNSEVQEIVVSLKKLSLEEVLLNKESNDSIDNLRSHIYRVLNNAHVRNSANKNDKIIDVLSSLIKMAQDEFDSAIKNTNLKALAIFLTFNSVLEIELKDLFKGHSISNKRKLVNNATKLLEIFGIKIKTHPDTPFNEIELFKEYEAGKRDGNIKKVYDFIEALERRNIGFPSNFITKQLILFLYQFNEPKFIKHLSGLNNPLQCVFYAKTFTLTDLRKISTHKSLKNKWMVFELIRQLIKKESRKIQLLDSDLSLLGNLIIRIKKIDEDHFSQTVVFFEKRSIAFNKALGRSISNLNIKDIENLFEKALPISVDSYFASVKSYLLEELKENLSDRKLEVVIRSVYKSWEKQYEKLNKSSEFINHLILTDYADFIGLYYYLLYNNEELIKKTQYLIVKLEYIDTEWFNNETDLKRTYCLYLTEVYFLSSVINYKKIENKELGKAFKRVLNNIKPEINNQLSKNNPYDEISTFLKYN